MKKVLLILVLVLILLLFVFLFLDTADSDSDNSIVSENEFRKKHGMPEQVVDKEGEKQFMFPENLVAQ